MRQDKSETLSFRPARPPRGRAVASLFDWPVTCVSDSPAAGTPPTESDAQRQWHKRFDVIIGGFQWHLVERHYKLCVKKHRRQVERSIVGWECLGHLSGLSLEQDKLQR